MKTSFQKFLSAGLLLLITYSSKAQIVFANLDSLLSYARSKSITIQTGHIKLDQAKKAKLAAVLSIPDVTGNASLSYTHNTRLPVSLFPAEVFGGQPGTFREVQTGIPYNTNFNENIDVKLLNLKGWENLKLSKLNIESSVSDNKITLKSLEENIAATYYNIVNLQEQLISTNKNLEAADTLLKITENKYAAGIAKQQDVNDAKVNYLTTKENSKQIEYLLAQQYLSLKILCDFPEQDSITITEQLLAAPNYTMPVITENNVAVTNSFLKEKVAFSNYKVQKNALYPTLSFFQSYTNQQFNTSSKFLDKSVSWIPSSYIGLRLSIPLPNANTISQVSKTRYDYLLAQKNTEQQKIKAGLEIKQLSVDYAKAVSQAKANNEIYKLRKETYEKNLNLYSEGLMSLEQTLNSFNTMVSSHYNLISSRITVLAAKAKIDINNHIK
ncbi:MAG: TolC family protein [Chitinophagaceae bacterium]|nr:TolC family protein [Chitinophagaceae bacterium]